MRLLFVVLAFFVPCRQVSGGSPPRAGPDAVSALPSEARRRGDKNRTKFPKLTVAFSIPI